jgi:hypothetical protein
LIEITVPESGTIEEFSHRLRAELEAMGFALQELEQDSGQDPGQDPDQDDEEEWL